MNLSSKLAALAALGLMTAACGSGAAKDAESPDAGSPAGEEMGDKAECKGQEGCQGEKAGEKMECKSGEGCHGKDGETPATPEAPAAPAE